MDIRISEIIERLFEKKSSSEAIVITLANFKGGVGKSTLNSILSYLATEKYGLKVLQIDSDPQMNLTNKMYRTYKNVAFPAKKTFMDGIRAENLKDSITLVNDKLSIIEGEWDLALLTDHIHKKLNADANFYLYDYLIKPLKKEYDLIFFDVIPTTTSYTNNCIVASDYAVMPTQTEEDAYDNTKTYIDYLITMKRDYNPKLELAGIVPYLVANDAVDIKLLKKYQEEYPDITFKNLIKRSARVKTWGLEGISEYKPYDKRTLDMYDMVFREMIERIAVLKKVL
ncbi:ParA family protein [Virgibacillus halodenitrificans]|uniref:ParA family protein n=1 Tax=Virgibacillus halodenitrificans TaxID=1482 RepID=UPI00045D03B8|nr:ParA family protein [Virgibacillus halodenitrificans]CDQ37680.1 Sporulation initiation inhibitor protein soj [Virgibacillus halodenitrificans]